MMRVDDDRVKKVMMNLAAQALMAGIPVRPIWEKPLETEEHKAYRRERKRVKKDRARGKRTHL